MAWTEAVFPKVWLMQRGHGRLSIKENCNCYRKGIILICNRKDITAHEIWFHITSLKQG